MFLPFCRLAKKSPKANLEQPKVQEAREGGKVKEEGGKEREGRGMGGEGRGLPQNGFSACYQAPSAPPFFLRGLGNPNKICKIEFVEFNESATKIKIKIKKYPGGERGGGARKGGGREGEAPPLSPSNFFFGFLKGLSKPNKFLKNQTCTTWRICQKAKNQN